MKEAKISDITNIDKLKILDPLSLGYDKISVQKPYQTRVNGALLALLFFEKLEKSQTNFMSQDAADFISGLSEVVIKLKKQGLEPNQIFMLMFSESINQSIISDSGLNYEDRILIVLKKIGIDEKNIKKTHDKNDRSTEFDFFFEIDKRSYGIGAKRTLRERYKQFIKTAQMSKIDVMIQITLGLDLNEEKAKIMGYKPFKGIIPHHTVNHSRKEYVNGIAHTNTIESFWAIFKRGIKGQFHFVSPKYLSRYLDEFCWRFNNKDSEFMFEKLLTNCIK